MADLETDALGRGHMTQGKRIELLERDRAQQSRVLSELIAKVGQGFTPEQLDQLRGVMRDELGDAGLRIEGAEHQDEAREDFRFLRKLRKAFDGISTQVGRSILLGAIGVLAVIIGLGFWRWIGK
jgi:hypothetical protein